MKNFFKSRTIQGALLGIAGALFVTLLVNTFPFWNPFRDLSETIKYYFAPNTEYVSGLDVAKLSPADCWEQSLSSNRPDSYRCIVGEGIKDPCFTSEFQGSILTCPIDPYGHTEYFSVNISKLPVPPDVSSVKEDIPPWFIKLSDNTECQYDTGATSGV